MGKKNDGGPAFPYPPILHNDGQVEYGETGMTIRQWYAGRFLASMVVPQMGGIPKDDAGILLVVRLALRYADALIAEEFNET